MVHPELVTEEQLQELSGYRRRKDLRDWLDRNGVWHLEGKDGRIGTTVAALNRAGMGREQVEFI